MQTAGGAAAQAMALKAQLQPFSGEEIVPPVAYPEGEGDWFGESLSALAAMLHAGLPIRCAALSAPGGFDTHDNQAESFDTDIRSRPNRSPPSRPTSRRVGSPTG